MPEKARKRQSTSSEYKEYERQGSIALKACREAIKRIKILNSHLIHIIVLTRYGKYYFKMWAMT